MEAFGRDAGRRPADAYVLKFPYAKASLFHRFPANGLLGLFVFHAAGNRFHQWFATTEIQQRNTYLADHQSQAPFRIVREYANGSSVIQHGTPRRAAVGLP